jgi:hypothetical protein
MEEPFMILTNLILAAILVLLVGTLVFGIAMSFRTYLRYRGKRIITCPETHHPAAVHVDVGKAAREAFLGREKLQLDQCSRWPEKQHCGQECLSQVHDDPEHCLVWNMVANWYKGKSCAYCEKPFFEMHWHDRHPALLAPDHTVMQWNEVATEKLPEIFESYRPICWNCYVAEMFRRQNPDRVLDRPWERGAGGEYTPKRETPPAPQKRAMHS